MIGHSAGGNDAFVVSPGGVGSSFEVVGDCSGGISGAATGGNDSFSFSGHFLTAKFYGDAKGNLIGRAAGGSDWFSGSMVSTQSAIFYGDSGGSLVGNAAGGNDKFTIAGGSSALTVYGDAALDLTDRSVGGDDKFIANTSQFGQALTFFGDAGRDMSGVVQGGMDTFVAGKTGAISAYGDALSMLDRAQGGNDVLVGSDNLTSGGPPFGASSVLFGDAQRMSDQAQGGNDTLVSGTGRDQMWGDAQIMDGDARGGNDVFRFDVHSGFDRVGDFGQGLGAIAGSNWGTDRLDVRALGIHAFSELDISAYDFITHESTILLNSEDHVVVRSQVALRASDFIFADT